MRDKGLLTVLLSFISFSIFAQTGFIETFNDNTLAPGWQANANYGLAEANQELEITAINAGKSWVGFGFNFGSTNISSTPYVSIKVKSNTGFALRIDLQDVNGRYTNQTDVINTISNSGSYDTYYFDFTGKFYQQWGANPGPVDPTQIQRIVFIFNPGNAASAGFTGTVYFDSLMIGSDALTPPAPDISGIKLNQIGFYPQAKKAAIISGGTGTEFYLSSPDLQDTVYTGTLGTAKYWSYSNDNVKVADFSNFDSIGEFKVLVEGLPESHTFEIKNKVHESLGKGAIKALYYQRVSMALTAPYAGIWARAAGHSITDKNVLIHASAVSPGRPENSTISSPGGWYDAGDYNKYIVNSGISTYTLLAAYEHFPDYFDTLALNIPESSNTIPDVLDEALYNIRWMLTMQDPYDGGVYHKLTNENFDGTVMPSAANNPRYVVQKSTEATLNFTAVMAQSARIFSNFNTELPGLSDSCLIAASRAWSWANNNPDTRYVQNTLNANFDPNINTGEYSGGNNASSLNDEFEWAAAELYTSTKNTTYLSRFNANSWAGVPSWPNVNTLGFISLAHNRKQFTSNSDTSTYKSKITSLANTLRAYYMTSAYNVSMGVNSWDYVWGSNGTAANQGFILLQAFNITKDSTYLDAAIASLDYLLGRNPTDYCFVTGFGDNSTLNPHHRISGADGITAPIPGFLAGGPHSGQNDGGSCVGYISSLPGLSYLDKYCSYSTNEIAINWNTPLAYLAGAIEATYAGISSKSKSYTVNTGVLGNQSKLLSSENNLLIYPNPSRSELTILSKENINDVEKITISDLQGKVIYDLSEQKNLLSSGISVDLKTMQLSEGVYILKITSGNQAITKKLVYQQ